MGFSVATTLVTPAASYALTDLATVKTELAIAATDISNDAWLTLAITQVSKALARHCKRGFVVETVQDAFDIEQDAYPYQTPGGFSQLQLTRWPVTTLTSVIQTTSSTTTQALVSGTDFSLDAAAGRLLRLNPFTGVGTGWEAIPVTVIYAAGYATIPDDLVEACLRVITARFRARGRDPALVQRDTPGIGTERWWFGTAPGQSGPFPPDIAAMLSEYRVPTLA